MRYVKITGYPIIFAYDKADMKEGLGTPDELLDAIQRKFRECAIVHTVKLTETDLKDCKHCDHWIDGRCDYYPTLQMWMMTDSVLDSSGGNTDGYRVGYGFSEQ